MPTKLELLQEAYNRGILPDDKKQLFEEAQRRGLVNGRSALDEAAPKIQAIQDQRADTAAQGEITDREQGRKFGPIRTNDDGSTDYGYTYDPAGGQQMSHGEKLAVTQAYRSDIAGRDIPQGQTAQQMEGQIRGATAAQNSNVENFGGAAADTLAHFGTSLLGTVAPKTANSLEGGLGYTYDPDTKSAMLGKLTGMAIPLIPAMAAAPGAIASEALPYVMGAQGVGGARQDAARRRDAGQDVGLGAEATDAVLQGGLNFAGAKVSLGGMTNEIANPVLRHGAAGLVGAAENAMLPSVSSGITAATMNDLSAVHGPTLEDATIGGILGLGGAAMHQLVHGAPKTEEAPHAAPERAVETPAEKPPVAEAPKSAETPNPVEAKPAVEKPIEPPAAAKPEVPAEIRSAGKAKIREWAEANGYDATALEGKGKRPMLNEIDSQRLAHEAGRVMDVTRQENVRAMGEQAQLPADADSWDAGRLRRFAKENGYEINEQRVAHEQAARDEKPRDLVRRQIEEQYALPKGEGKEGVAPERLKPMTPEEKAARTPAEEPKSFKQQVDDALAEGDAKLAAEDAAQAKTKAAAPAAETPSKGLPRVPPEARKWSYTKLQRWAKKSGYTTGKLQNLNALRKGITKQRSNSMIDLPEVPKANRKWNYRRFKYWAEQSGYDTSKVQNRYDLKREIVAQRKAAKAAARQAESRPSKLGDTERESLRQELAKEKALRRTDDLTGAPNKIAYDEDAARIFKDADAKGEHVGIVETDVGGLKVMNTVYGHSGGDEMLKMAHEAMRSELRMPPQKDRPGDYLGSAAYRIGGDEFPAILRGVKTKGDIKAAMDRVNAKFDKMIAEKFPDLPPEARPFIAHNGEIRAPKDVRDVHEIRKAADAGVEAAKSAVKKGRNIPEGRTDLLNYIEAYKSKIAKASAQAVAAAGGGGTPGTPAAAKAPKSNVVQTVMNKKGRWVPQGLEELITPISSRLLDVSPPMYNRLMRMEFNTGVMRERIKGELHDPAGRIVADLGGPKGDKYQDFRLHVANQEHEAAKALLSSDALRGDFDKFTAAYDELHKHTTDNGVNVGKLDDFWPRHVKDHEAFDAVYGNGNGRFDDAWEIATQRKGKALTPAEKADIANDVLQGYGPIKPGSQGFPNARERSIDKITRDQLEHYVDPFESAFRYVDGAAYAGERAKFLGRSEDPAKLPESIGKIVREQAGNLDKAQQQEVTDLMHARFTADFLTPSKGVRRAKELMYLSTLGNVRSAISQLSDIATAAAKYGMKAAAKGVKAEFGPADKKILMEEMGFHEHGAEFRDVTKVSKLLDKTLTWTGFKRIDRLGKEIHATSAWKGFQEAARNPDSSAFKRLERDYRPVLGSQFDATVRDLKAGVKSENVKYLSMLELSRVQPVTLSQMPEAYLRSKNGRIFYALKTFTITALDNLRRDTFRKLATPGQRREGLANLAGYTVLVGLAGFGKDLVSDLIRGKQVDADQIPDRSVNAMLSMIGLNRYTVGKATQKPSDGLVNFLMPPLSFADNAWQDATHKPVDDKGNFKGFKSIQTTPVVGDLLYYWTPLGAGFNKNTEDAKKDFNAKLAKLRKAATEDVAAGNTDDAAALLTIYNERRRNAPSGVVTKKAPETVASVKARMFRATQKKQQTGAVK